MPHNTLVTGASSDIGRACALEPVRRGFGVALNDLPGVDTLDAAAREASALGAGAAPADLAAIDRHEAMLEIVEPALGPLTTLVCNASVPALARVDVLKTGMTAPMMDQYRRRIAEEGLSLVPRADRPEEVAATIATTVTGGLPYAAGQLLRPDGGLALERL